jgi:hypothetical protein
MLLDGRVALGFESASQPLLRRTGESASQLEGF